MDDENLEQLPDVERRMEVIRDSARHPGNFYSALVAQSAGSLRSAAIADLAIDGNLHHVDLRRAPFAGDEDLKGLYRGALAAQQELANALLQVGWKQ